MSREKGKKHGVVNYKVKSFSININTVEKMDQYERVPFSTVVNRILDSFLEILSQNPGMDPLYVLDQFLGEKEEPE